MRRLGGYPRGQIAKIVGSLLGSSNQDNIFYDVTYDRELTFLSANVLGNQTGMPFGVPAFLRSMGWYRTYPRRRSAV